MSLAENHRCSVTSVHHVGVSVHCGWVDLLTQGRSHVTNALMLNQGIPWLGIFILDSNSREKHETHPPYDYIFGTRRWRCPS